MLKGRFQLVFESSFSFALPLLKLTKLFRRCILWHSIQSKQKYFRWRTFWCSLRDFTSNIRFHHIILRMHGYFKRLVNVIEPHGILLWPEADETWSSSCCIGISMKNSDESAPGHCVTVKAMYWVVGYFNWLPVSHNLPTLNFRIFNSAGREQHSQNTTLPPIHLSSRWFKVPN